MTTHLDRVKCTKDLPDEWDRLATDYYQKKVFLRHCQEYNPCRQGIVSGAAIIDLGQSAEIPKMRLGGTPREKIILTYHSQPLANRMLRALIGLLSYHGRFPDTHVFKEGVS